MRFIHPEWFWLLAALPFFLVWACRGESARERGWKALGRSGKPVSGGRLRRCSAVLFAIAALSRPTWGRLGEFEEAAGRDLAIVMDVSKSMAAEDASPNRLEAARESAKALLEVSRHSKGDRVAVVAFAGRGETRCALTEDIDAAIEAIDKLAPGAVSPGGTNLRRALETAADDFDDEAHSGGRAVVVFSDGEDLDGDWPLVLPRLKERRIVVHAVAVGDDRAGAEIPIPDAGRPLTYRGQKVITKRRDEALRRLAEATGGSFVPLGLGTVDFGALYRDRIEPLALRRREATGLSRRAERYPIALGLALALTVLVDGPRRRFRIPPLKARPRILLGAATIVLLVGAGRFETPRRAVDEGLRFYRAGNLAQAEAAFRRALTVSPTDPIAHYDLAAVLYRRKRYREAIEHYQAARRRADPGLRMKIDYGLGNSAIAAGNVRQAIRYYDLCISSRASGPTYDAIRGDARTNRLFAVRLSDRRPDSENQRESAESANRPEGNDSQDLAKRSTANSKGVADSKGASNVAEGGRSRRDSSSRTGGAGGSSPSSDRSEASPTTRLALALRDLNEALKRRIEPASKAENDPNRRDW